MSVLITFDGPKGVGKTTLIRHVEQRLREADRSVEVLVEKELMATALGQPLEDAYRALKRAPGEASDAQVARLHRRGRVLIGEHQLNARTADVVLLDRWYPSDAVFRRHIDVVEAIEANLRDGVRVPDIAFAVICRAEVSWERAHQRARRLDSKVIDSFDDHRASTERFERLAIDYGWHVLESDSTSADELSRKVIVAIEQKFS
ncbi:MAG: hypothetical protein EPN73_02250 [Paraburkholderia sp.]|uniref:hypothetical protein n=1 Tax=Paraburkholderia sp. TaxID=1926495 RepID=UPI0012171B72|nr:hypothetical protein [Paraburkholderia sp.]TAL98754.1 MAG: hypothetical protein EPN73_02250 [Paraburkholderia sp.]